MPKFAIVSFNLLFVMAKSKSFFGLRSGSTKSFTFQVLNGEQITKDRVYNVKNRRTTKQMAQRLAFGVVAQATAKLQELIGISMQNISNPIVAKKEFRSINIQNLVRTWKQNPRSVFFNPKGESQLIPNAYIISKGTEYNAGMGYISVEAGPNGDVFKQVSTREFQLDINSPYTAKEVLRIVFAMEPGDQVTVVGIGVNEEVNMFPDDLQYLRKGEMRSVRLVAPTEEELANVNELTLTGETVGACATQLQEYLVDLLELVGAKSNANLFQFLTVADNFTGRIEEDGSGYKRGYFTFLGSDSYAVTNNLTFADTLGFNGADKVMALGYFRSHYDDYAKTWKFSTCKLALRQPVITAETFNNADITNWGLTFDAALNTYLGSDSSESDLYTETGGPDNSLGF